MARKLNVEKLKEKIENLCKLREKREANYLKAAKALEKRNMTITKLKGKIANLEKKLPTEEPKKE